MKYLFYVILLLYIELVLLCCMWCYDFKYLLDRYIKNTNIIWQHKMFCINGHSNRPIKYKQIHQRIKSVDIFQRPKVSPIIKWGRRVNLWCAQLLPLVRITLITSIRDGRSKTKKVIDVVEFSRLSFYSLRKLGFFVFLWSFISLCVV
jgi:hypothetical protein